MVAGKVGRLRQGEHTRSNRVSNDLGADFGSVHVWGMKQGMEPRTRQRVDQCKSARRL